MRKATHPARHGERKGASAWSETSSMCGTSMRENRDTSCSPSGNAPEGRDGKAIGQKPSMHGCEESDRPVVPAKSSNKTGKPEAEVMEGSGLVKENSGQQNTRRTQCRGSVYNALDRVRIAARRNKAERFSALFHHVTPERLWAAFFDIKKRAAPGVDGVTWEQYERDLDRNIANLHSRLHRGAYRAKPSRRVYIPKSDGRQRPLGIAALEDKIAQRCMAEVLSAIYETDFLGFSYGFRPGRKAHEALDALVVGIKTKKIDWILDADIRGYFDAINHNWMMKFLEHRVADKRMLRLIQKWLKAGVVEDGKWTESQVGSPQGASLSPLLANVYLHYVLDLWVQQWRKRNEQGDVIIVRWADDFVIGFQHEGEAKRFLEELHSRLKKFSLELHSEKTRLIRFGRYAKQNAVRYDKCRKPETFNFLGFTHHCGVSRNGKFMIGRTTMRKRLTAKLKEVKMELKKRMHEPILEQGRWLASVIRGYFNYHAIHGNKRRISAFRYRVTCMWYRTLQRRSQKDSITWEQMNTRVDAWFPKICILHPWPEQRFAATIQDRSRMR